MVNNGIKLPTSTGFLAGFPSTVCHQKMCDLNSSPFGGGPKFEPLYRDMYDEDEDWNEFLGAEGVGGKKRVAKHEEKPLGKDG